MPDELIMVLAASALAVVALMAAVWVLSVVLRDASVVDICWGVGFVVVGWLAFALGDGWAPRKLLITGLATIWGLRLALHLFVRNWGHGEDPRYRSMRKRHPGNFPAWSLVNVFGLQGVLMWTISLPLQVAQVSGGPDGLTVLDIAGVAVWLVGFVFEVVGDWQLRQFKADPANKETVMDRGLWRYTRHPNYFGDSVQWWGFFLIALSHWQMGWVAVSPILMTILLTRVSGVPLLERSMAKRRPGYEEYVRRTSAFFPLPPKRAG